MSTAISNISRLWLVEIMNLAIFIFNEGPHLLLTSAVNRLFDIVKANGPYYILKNKLIFILTAGPMEIYLGQMGDWPNGPTRPGEIILKVEPCDNLSVFKMQLTSETILVHCICGERSRRSLGPSLWGPMEPRCSCVSERSCPRCWKPVATCLLKKSGYFYPCRG